jgi:signal transduction histidine kinase
MKTIVDGELTSGCCKLIASSLTSLDVLTMSKLNSGLFVMTPVDVRLDSIARDAVKMFEGEAKSAGIGLVLRIEDSCKQSNIEQVSLDPTRVLQILIVGLPLHSMPAQ